MDHQKFHHFQIRTDSQKSPLPSHRRRWCVTLCWVHWQLSIFCYSALYNYKPILNNILFQSRPSLINPKKSTLTRSSWEISDTGNSSLDPRTHAVLFSPTSTCAAFLSASRSTQCRTASRRVALLSAPFASWSVALEMPGEDSAGAGPLELFLKIGLDERTAKNTVANNKVTANLTAVIHEVSI